MTDYGRGVTTTVGLISGGTAVNTVPQHCRFVVDLRVETASDGETYRPRSWASGRTTPTCGLALPEA